MLKRLKFGVKWELEKFLAGIAELTGLADPLNKITLDRELDAGLRLCRQTCAIGVIGVIFEARRTRYEGSGGFSVHQERKLRHAERRR